MGHGPGAIKKKAARLLKVPETSIRRVDVVRRSIDARKKDRILYSYIVDVKLAEKKKEETAVKKADSRNIQIETEARYRYPAHGKEVLKDRPVIIGAGPGRAFCGPGPGGERLCPPSFRTGRSGGGAGREGGGVLEERG